MIAYKFTRNPNDPYSIFGYSYPGDTSTKKELVSDIIISMQDEFEVDGVRYIENISDGFFYEAYHKYKKVNNFTKEIIVDAQVVPECKSGLRIYESIYSDWSTIYGSLNVDDHVWMNMKFITDNNQNIWASVTVVKPDGTIQEGYVIYKNARNNFTNLIMYGTTYPTVLTKGVVDEKKVESAKQQTPMLYALRSTTRAASNKSNTTTTEASSRVTNNKSKKSANKIKKEEISAIEAISQHAPSVVQNSEKFPPYVATTKGGSVHYDYDYQLTYPPETFEDLQDIYRHANMDVRTIAALAKNQMNAYNRFKLSHPDDILSKGFVHIFFTRPDLNLFTDKGALLSHIGSDGYFQYKYKQNPDLFKQLTINSGDSHDFMMILSNKAESFSFSDRGLENDSYGTSYSGHNVRFARRKTPTSGDIDIQYRDDRDLNILNLHELWITYIANVYRGKWSPKSKYIWQKVLDYACSVYVIVTAEDFETILYWSKYYGVFPLNVPYSSLSWNTGTPISNINYTISYGYSWKEDYNPFALTELNANAFRKAIPTSAQYMPVYNQNLGHVGPTWVGAPFVETIYTPDPAIPDLTNNSKLTLKLRFLSK